MNKLIVNFENCYGISKLEGEFDFSLRKTCAIYAPNGVMKTSFARTFKDLSKSEDSRDLVFSERKTKREIKDESSIDIKAEDVFVIEPYDAQFNSDKLSTLLVTKELKKEYDEIYQAIEIEKNNFIKKLKAVSQSTDCESEFTSTFLTDGNENFFELLSQTMTKLDGKQTKYEFRYNDIFDKKGYVKMFLTTHKDSLDLYVQNYESLISQSKLFKKSDNTFGTYQASEILKSISNNSFFDAGHLLELADSTQIHSAEDFKNLLETELDKVMSDNELKKIFDKVDKAIGSNVELRAFKAVIEKYNLLLVELKDYESFKKNVWLGYLNQLKRDVESLVNFYNERKTQLEDIIFRAKNEKTEWERSIDEFNARFKGLPFRLSIKNKEDVMLKTSAPSVEFIFHDRGDEKVIDRDQLFVVLSQGERRALYLLNIIFEVSARRKLSQSTIFIIDDIADSFDYKNKYAIIEYLVDISNTNNFYQIILTHNFDFFRTLESRDVVGYTNCYFTYKSNTKVFLEKATGIKNPFINDWKKNLGENKKLIASIPFIRNIIEYTKDEEDLDYKKLTSLLHWKEDTETILTSDLKSIFDKNIKGANFPSTDLAKKVVDRIFQEAETCLTADEGINFENKIVLSIAIRLKAEKFMIDKISDSVFINNILKNQTVKLIIKYKELFKDEKNNIDLLEQVNLMTPENIHLNSFMYEPIIDLGMDHLKDLYSKMKKIS
jgi:hypothetical protein